MQAGRSYGHAAFAIAAWIRFLQGTDEHGEDIFIDDPQAEVLREAARACTDSVAPFLALDFVFPARLRDDSGFAGEVSRWFGRIREKGTQKALREHLSE
jgi:mannitol-1-phosphate/altronate dehydrogenase